MSKRTITVLVVLVVLLGGLAGWNVAWRYDEAVFSTGVSQIDAAMYGTPRYERVKVRTHIFTGASERLTAQGWVPLDPRTVRKP